MEQHGPDLYQPSTENPKPSFVLSEATTHDVEDILKLDEIAKIASTGTGFGIDLDQRRKSLTSMIELSNEFQFYLVKSDAGETVGSVMISLKPSPEEFSVKNDQPILPESYSGPLPIPYEEFLSILTSPETRSTLARIDSMAITPALQKQGVGNQVNVEIENKLKDRGISFLSFNTNVKHLIDSAPRRGFTIYHTSYYSENRPKYTGLKKL